MPALATGAMLANRKLMAIGVSGDGDTASIGMGQFVHLLRRNMPMIYIIENNGVYGLTKGQFSATADLGSKLKSGVVNDLPAIDICALAIELGATFVGPLVRRRPEADARALEGGARTSRHGAVRRDHRPASRSTITKAPPRATSTPRITTNCSTKSASCRSSSRSPWTTSPARSRK